MAFDKTHDETKPAGSRAISLGDDDIRELKYAFRERLAIDHYAYDDESGHSDTGYHKIIHLMVQTAITQLANAICVYGKDVGGKCELHTKDEDGNEVQLTSGGVLLDSVLAKTGDWMLSSVTTARTGWTNVTATYADKFIRLNATPLGTGGADAHTHAAGTYAGPSHTHTGPSHTHSVSGTTSATGQVNTGGNQGVLYAATPNHTHTWSDTSSAGGTGATGAGGTGAVTGSSASASNVPAYIECVVFQKD